MRKLSMTIYGAFALLAVLWGALRGQPNLYQHPAPWWQLTFPVATVLSLSLGLLVGAAVVVATKSLVERAEWARALHVEFRSMLGPVTSRDIAVIAVTSGVAEELFFRGAMLPAVGIVASSLVFGAVHVGRPLRRMLPWTAWATVMGFIFAAIYAATGELLGAAVAHVLINYENLHYLRWHDPSRGEKPRAPLVIASLRVGR